METILTTKCLGCTHHSDTKDKNEIKCVLKNKIYFIGQKIPCEYYEKLKERKDNAND